MGGGRRFPDDWELAPLTNVVSTLALVGKTGNGKSATANSILNRTAFNSQPSFSGVTRTCEMQSSTFEDGRTVNVIDTPGLFDCSSRSEFISEEIAKCLDLAKGGIHAVLVVFSIKSRFSEEERSTIKTLRTIFGEKITDFMIVVFTNGDSLPDGMTIKEYLDRDCPEDLKRFLELCKNRAVLFDNKSKDVSKQTKQVHQLLSFVDSVVAANDGKTFCDQFLAELKTMHDEKKEDESSKGFTEQQISYEYPLAQITEMVEQKLNQTIDRLEKRLAEEEAARAAAQEAQERSAKEIRKLQGSLGKQLEAERKAAEKKWEQEINNLKESLDRAQRDKCAIL